MRDAMGGRIESELRNDNIACGRHSMGETQRERTTFRKRDEETTGRSKERVHRAGQQDQAARYESNMY